MPKYVVKNPQDPLLIQARKIARHVWTRNRVSGKAAVTDSNKDARVNRTMHHIVNQHPQTIPLMPSNGSPLSYKSSKTDLDILHDMIFDTVIFRTELHVDKVTRKYFSGLNEALKKEGIDFNALRGCLAPSSQQRADAYSRMAQAPSEHTVLQFFLEDEQMDWYSTFNMQGTVIVCEEEEIDAQFVEYKRFNHVRVAAENIVMSSGTSEPVLLSNPHSTETTSTSSEQLKHK